LGYSGFIIPTELLMSSSGFALETWASYLAWDVFF
jgi:hypothetical protein